MIDYVQEIESIVMEYSGPMGKFVVKKQIKDMAMDVDRMSEGHRRELINRIVTSAIFNDKYKQECTNRLKALLIAKSINV